MKLEEIKNTINTDFDSIPKNLLFKYKLVLFKWACFEGHLDTSKKIKHLDTSKKTKLKNKINLLHNDLELYKDSIDNCQYEIFKWLYMAEEINIKDSVKLFEHAIGNESYIIAKWLYDKHGETNDIEDFINHLNVKDTLSKICERNSPEIFDWFLQIIPDINSECYSNAFVIACSEGFFELAKKIYSIGRVDLSYNHTACFRFSICSGHIMIARWLYSLGNINVNDTVDRVTRPLLDPEIETALYLTIEYGKWETAQVKEGYIEFPIYDNKQIMTLKLDSVKWLVEIGARVNKTDFDLSIGSGYLDVSKFLLDKVVNMDEFGGLSGSFAHSLYNDRTETCDWIISVDRDLSNIGAELYFDEYFCRGLHTCAEDEKGHIDLDHHIGINYLLNCKELGYYQNYQKIFEKLCFERKFDDLIKTDTISLFFVPKYQTRQVHHIFNTYITKDFYKKYKSQITLNQ